MQISSPRPARDQFKRLLSNIICTEFTHSWTLCYCCCDTQWHFKTLLIKLIIVRLIMARPGTGRQLSNAIGE